MQAKNHIKTLIIAPMVLAAVAVLAGWAGGFFNGEKAEDTLSFAHPSPARAVPKIGAPRESITFVMGEDSGPGNRYYSQALEYYQFNPQARTERLITDARSLLAVRDYLESHPPANGLPWGHINIVVHSNEWTGMEAPVLPGGKRSNTATIRAAMAQGDFPPLVDALIDSETQMNVYGCALGRDRELMEALSEAFGGEAPDPERPVVRSSPYFINYFTERANGRPMACRRLLTDYRYTFYPTGYRPADYQLVRQFRARYPGDSLDIADALSREAPRFPGDSYHHTFRVPVVCLVTYEHASERPDFSTEDQRMAWLNSRTELDSLFAAYQLDKKLFTWTFQKIRHEMPEGGKVPAVKLIGLCDVLCVLQPLKNEDGSLVTPVPEDARYFTEVGPAKVDGRFSGR